MRHAYIKHNNVVRELERVGPNPTVLPEGGPDAYLAHFLQLAKDEPVLVIGIHYDSNRDEVLRWNNVEARSYYWYSRLFGSLDDLGKKPVATFGTRLLASTKIFLHLVRFRPDRILCWSNSFPLWAAFLASRAFSLPFVCSRQTRLVAPGEPWFRRLTGAIDNWIMRQAEAVLVHGPYMRQQLLGIGIDPAKLFEFNWSFEHMLRPSVTRDEIPAIDDDGKSKVILFVGRVQKSKGVFDLLDACSDRLRQDHKVKLVYAGQGTDLAELRSRTTKRGMDKQVLFLGRVPHDVLAGVIKQSSVLVTPTQSWFPEGRCMATMEGLVMGIPVIVPDFGPFPYLVTHGENGLLFKADSVGDLRAKITSVLDDRELYERLRRGAQKTSMEIRTAPVNFSQAVEAAFAYAIRKSSK